MELSVRGLKSRRASAGLPARFFVWVGMAVVLVLLAALAALSLLVMALVGVVMGAERLLALLVPAYRRRRQRFLTMPAGLVRTVRFGSGRGQVIEARSYEPPRGAPQPGRSAGGTIPRQPSAGDRGVGHTG